MEEEDSTKMNLNETGRECEQRTASSEQDIVAGCCEGGNEPWGSKKFGEFVKQLRQYHTIKGQSLSWQLRVRTKKAII
jgi:hypothetical protein